MLYQNSNPAKIARLQEEINKNKATKIAEKKNAIPDDIK